MKNLNIILLTLVAILFCNCTKPVNKTPNKGVSQYLAKKRAKVLSNINYQLSFNIKETKTLDIPSNLKLSFNINDINDNLIIDFKETNDKILDITIKDKKIKYTFINEHIIIAKEYLLLGKNIININFLAGTASLNRNSNFLYTLLVADKARSLFPCFDQPNLKANFKLKLNIPPTWIAVSNSKLLSKVNNSYTFEETKKIPTYLFSFVAGEFKTISRTYKAKEYILYHMETDTIKLSDNVDSIFDILFKSIDWMEEYTQIEYPFSKFDIIALPVFQCGGMEIPGATLYKASSIFLNKDASKTKILVRANLITHETSHMWFGDLVSIVWFDQVWLKEVFANLMADKMIKSFFPEVNNKLRFFINHFYKAYKVDRSTGSNPINQELDNLENAGSLYGSIIYHKAPIVMQKLENIIGESKLRTGLQEYLTKYSFTNASWENLISILDSKTEINLKRWSYQWVNKTQIPKIEYKIKYDENNKIKEFKISQEDPSGEQKIWEQTLSLKLKYENNTEEIDVYLDKKEISVTKLIGLKKPLYIIPNSKGIEYGLFSIDSTSMAFFIKDLHKIKSDLQRAIIWSNIWENLYKQNISPSQFTLCLTNNIPHENKDLIIEKLLRNIADFYWHYINKEERKIINPILEKLLWTEINNREEKSLKKSFFICLIKISESKKTINKLMEIWEKKQDIKNMALSSDDYTNLAYNLCIKCPSYYNYITYTQEDRINNIFELKKFLFIKPALSNDINERDNFFESLKHKSNRKHETWTNIALYLLNHPLRQNQSIKYLEQCLILLEEVKETGDVFTSKSWLNACYSGHVSEQAREITDKFLSERKNYPLDLKLKILQASQHTYR